jgi:hypothetical protein
VQPGVVPVFLHLRERMPRMPPVGGVEVVRCGPRN